ncbi:MAG TPA: hypothetical protein VHM70_02585 [Polyangiaceae bacterium]|jgi:hypothetical protein|nr:hypothetical protein [Polyangiaceae bacterium]
MDLGWTQALPFGLLMFAGSAIAARRRKLRQSRAGRNYPLLAGKLGLELEPARYPGWVGRLRGRFQGFDVLVEPDERPRIVVRFAAASLLDLRTYEHWKRVPEGYQVLSLGKRRLDQRFINRFGRTQLAPDAANIDALTTALEAILDSTEGLRQLTIDADRIECLLDYGNPPVIPAPEVERLLPLLSALAERVTELSSESAVSPSETT